jgi:phage regulator Rha-like protein
MEKVKVSREQAEAIEELTKVLFNPTIVITHIRDRFRDEKTECINSMPVDSLIRALYIGYEVEPEFKVGDWVAFDNRKDEVAIRKIERINDQFGDGLYAHWKNGSMRLSGLRHATPSEIAEEKERRFFARYGREPWELRKGDWLIQQAERMEELDETLNDTWYMRTSKKLGELNEFLQKRQSKGVGENVIDVAMSHIRKQEMTIAGNETTRRQLVERVEELESKLDHIWNLKHEYYNQSKRYKQVLELVEKKLECARNSSVETIRYAYIKDSLEFIDEALEQEND